MFTIWVMTQNGFYSVVEYAAGMDESNHEAPRGSLLVRARVQNDLEALAEYIPTLKIWKDSSADYAFRTIMTRDQWATCLGREIQGIDYSNFKNRVSSRQGELRARVYHQIWLALLSLQNDEG